MGSTLSEFMLEMCPVHGHKRLSTTTHFSRLSLQESNGVACSMSRGFVLLKHKIIVYRQRVASKQESSLFTLTPNLSNMIVTSCAAKWPPQYAPAPP